jgi:taurine transport system permease protein
MQRSPARKLIDLLGRDSRTKEIGLTVLSVIAAIALWQLISSSGRVPTRLLPGPLAVVNAFMNIWTNGFRDTTLLENVFATLYRCIAGYLLACVVGVPIGLIMGMSRRLAAAIDVEIQFMRTIPPLAYVVLLIIWFGAGDTSKIALLFLTAFPLVATAAAAGVRATSLQKIQAMESLGATRSHVFRYLVLPSALPQLLTGMRIALAITFSAVVGSEIVAATDGLGWMVFTASYFLRYDVVIVAILILGVAGVSLNTVILVFDTRLIHWRGKA